MFLLTTLAGVTLGYSYAALVDRRYGFKDYRRWLLLAPLWVLYVIVLLTADTGELAPQAVQAFAIGTLGATMIDVVGSLWLRRGNRSRAEASTHGANRTT